MRISDWSSDVCSSDLHHSLAQIAAHEALILAPEYAEDLARSHVLLALHDTCGLVATAGWLAMPDRPETARIRKVFVHPAMARRGLASTMVRAAEAAARAAGRPHLLVRANLTALPLSEPPADPPPDPGLLHPGAANLPVLF